MRQPGSWTLMIALLALPACQDKPADALPAGARPPAAPAPSASQPLLAPLATNLPSWPVPGGVPLPIQPGKGVGPIRFGARLDTIERLMGEPCDEQVPLAAAAKAGAPAPAAAAAEGAAPPADLLCRYAARAVEFELHGGVLTQIHVHRPARPFSPERGFGVYNGRFEKGDAALGMFAFAAQESLGKPTRVEPRDGSGPYRTVEIHDYPGMQLEYDRLPNKNVVLGGVILSAPR
jgi:hypothetical protein